MVGCTLATTLGGLWFWTSTSYTSYFRGEVTFSRVYLTPTFSLEDSSILLVLYFQADGPMAVDRPLHLYSAQVLGTLPENVTRIFIRVLIAGSATHSSDFNQSIGSPPNEYTGYSLNLQGDFVPLSQGAYNISAWMIIWSGSQTIYPGVPSDTSRPGLFIQSGQAWSEYQNYRFTALGVFLAPALTADYGVTKVLPKLWKFLTAKIAVGRSGGSPPGKG